MNKKDLAMIVIVLILISSIMIYFYYPRPQERKSLNAVKISNVSWKVEENENAGYTVKVFVTTEGNGENITIYCYGTVHVNSLTGTSTLLTELKHDDTRAGSATASVFYFTVPYPYEYGEEFFASLDKPTLPEVKKDFDALFQSNILNLTSLTTTRVGEPNEGYYNATTWVPSFSIENIGKKPLYNFTIRITVSPNPATLMVLDLGTIQPGETKTGGGYNYLQKDAVFATAKPGTYQDKVLEIYMCANEMPSGGNQVIEGEGSTLINWTLR